MKTKFLVLGALVAPLLVLQGCALDAFDPKPDDPAYAPALPEEPYTYATPTGSIYSPFNVTNGLYTDTRAHRVGDLISVTLEESTSSSKNASTSLDSENSYNIGSTTLAGHNVHYKSYDTTASHSSEDSFSGSSSASESNSLSGQISVSVVKVYSNGNLEVRGEKWLMLNNGNEYVRVTGLVRPDDIAADNTVSSQRIANARIQYGGTGDFANTQERGWLSKFLNSCFNIFF